MEEFLPILIHNDHLYEIGKTQGKLRRTLFVLDSIENNKMETVLISDAEKAFDSVNWDFYTEC